MGSVSKNIFLNKEVPHICMEWCWKKRPIQLKWRGIRVEQHKRHCTGSRRRTSWIHMGREEELGWRV